MTNFIALTFDTGRALVNVRHFVAIVEQDGNVYIGVGDQPAELVRETYDEILDRINKSVTKVI